MDAPPETVPARAPDAPATVGPSDPHRLLIRVSTGSGAAATRLAAFDTALYAAGVSGFNIIRLSSVIPAHAVVREVPGADQIQGALGDVAYCVYAEAYASTPGEQAWAGLAWAMDPESGAGIFVEHGACSEAVVRRDLTATIEAMSRTRDGRYRLAGQTVSSAVCVDHPVCALVVASYGTAGWSELLSTRG